MVIFYKLHSIDLQTVVSNKCNFIMVFTNYCKLKLEIKKNKRLGSSQPPKKKITIVIEKKNK